MVVICLLYLQLMGALPPDFSQELWPLTPLGHISFQTLWTFNLAYTTGLTDQCVGFCEWSSRLCMVLQQQGGWKTLICRLARRTGNTRLPAVVWQRVGSVQFRVETPGQSHTRKTSSPLHLLTYLLIQLVVKSYWPRKVTGRLYFLTWLKPIRWARVRSKYILKPEFS